MPRAGERGCKFLAQLAEIALDPAFSANHYMVGIGKPLARQQLTEQRPEAPFHAVADHGIADPLRHGDAKALALPVIVAREQDETVPGNAQTLVGSEEIGATGEGFKVRWHFKASITEMPDHRKRCQSRSPIRSEPDRHRHSIRWSSWTTLPSGSRIIAVRIVRPPSSP